MEKMRRNLNMFLHSSFKKLPVTKSQSEFPVYYPYFNKILLKLTVILITLSRRTAICQSDAEV